MHISALLPVGLTATLMLASASFVASAAPPTMTKNVAIANFTFDPPVLTVVAGSTVTWTNRDDIPHTVTADDGSFRSSPLDTGDTWQERFDRPGTFVYFCSLHPHMMGKLVVTAPKG
jgi:plastocyanin